MSEITISETANAKAFPARRDFGRSRRGRRLPAAGLARISHHLTVEARNRPAITALRLPAVLNVLFKYTRIIKEMRRRASRALY